MITITQRNIKGNFQFLETISEIQFANRFTVPIVLEQFSDKDEERTRCKPWYIREWNDISDCVVEITFKYVACDDHGKVLPVSYLINIIIEHRAIRKTPYGYQDSWGHWHRYAVTGRKQLNSHYYRRFRLMQEKRWSLAWNGEEFAPKIRGKRTKSGLPDPWDDYPRRDLKNNNWKRYRKYQWKERK